jgi:uncharacterized protein (TIGR03437 family)
MGDILIQCSGSTPGAVLTGNLTVALPVSVTNRVGSTNLATDSVVFANLGTGFTPLPIAAQISNNLVVVNGLSVTVPASGTFGLRISNIRGTMTQFTGGLPLTTPVNALLTFSGGSIPINQSLLTVANVQSGLLASLYNRGSITCAGSPVPSTISLPDLFATGTFFATTRITEGFAASFQPRLGSDDAGTRFLLRFTGAPAGMRLFVPDYVAGSTAATPTAGGDMGVPQSGGAYIPGSNSLLLARVPNADASGAGGTALAGPSAPTAFTSASEVTVGADGTAYAVFEVLDANVTRQESAQIPVFVGMSNVSAVATVQETISMAPVSTVQTASTTAPMPRFGNTVATVGDCSAVGDCNAGYYPTLSLDAAPIQFTAIVTGAVQQLWGYVRVLNTGGGVMPWTASIQYTNGSGWAFVDPGAGVNNGAIRVTADAKGLAAGTYKANLVINAGSQTGSLPITLTVFPIPGGTGTSSGGSTNTGSSTGTGSTGSGTTPPAAAPTVTISRIVNAATFESTPLVAGSVGTVMGANLAGKTVSVTIDGVNADLLYTSAGQINLVVPAGLRGKNSATMVATVDGVSSTPQTVILAPAWPSIFAHGVVNQDNSVNGQEAAAAPGSILQIYATGIPEGATVSVEIAGRKDLIPMYAGVAPNVPGVQQVNVAVPDGVDAGAASLVVCAAAGGQQFCSPAYTLAVR